MGRLSTLTPLARYRWQVTARSLLAIFGGYALASGSAAFLALAMARAGMARIDAVTAANMLAFIVYACAALWIFAGASLRRACIGILLPAALLALGAWSMGGTA